MRPKWKRVSYRGGRFGCPRLYLVLYRKYDDTRGRHRPAGDLFDPTDGFAEGDGEPGGHPCLPGAGTSSPAIRRSRRWATGPSDGSGSAQGKPAMSTGIYHRFPHDHFYNRPYYTPVDLSQWFPELYQSLEDVLEEPFSYETSS